MSSPEVEKFEITDEDLLNEFNINRPTFRQSKQRAALGIWADDSDEDERPVFGKKKKADYKAPIGFVSGGVKVGDKISKDGEGGGGEGNDSADSDAEYDRIVLEAALKRRNQAQPKKHYMPGTHGDASIGGWERHTKGVASKLMEKMGYVPGKGIGKNLQGIQTPVEAKQRKGKAAVGAYGSERTERSLQDFPIKPDEDEEAEKKFKQQLQQWKKPQATAEKKKKPKYVYKTADELIQEGPTKKKHAKDTSHMSKVKVIDMTGKEQRVLSGYHAIAHKHDVPEDEPVPYSQTQEKKAFDMPELLHNLDLLVDMAEDEIIQSDRKLKYQQDLVVSLAHEKEKMDTICDEEEKHINRMKAVLSVMEECDRRSKPGCPNPMSIEEYGRMFKHLQTEYYEEYKAYELSHLAVALVFPSLQKDFEGWNPINRPRHCLGTVKTWKDLIDSSTASKAYQGETQMTTYERLIWEVWMPHIRKTVQEGWSVRRPDSLLEVLEAWMPLLPEWVMNNILEQLVMPKLQTEVDSWNPLTDTMPIHAWLHPWLPLMGDRMEPLYAPIRHKLANALTNWHPSDPSAKMILDPWRGVFKKGHMDAFVVKNILPKLSLCMQEFTVNPSQQQLDAWNWVMNWLDMVPVTNIVSLLQKHFFPKWLQVLCNWLGAAPNYTEITKWYMGWKSMMPEVLMANDSVKEEFNKALGIMNRAVSGGNQQPGVRENVAYLTHTERRDFTPPPPPPGEPPSVRTVTTTSSMPASYKDLLEKKAAEHGLLFMPIPNKTWEAKQVYKFGKVQIYLDRNVVFVLERDGLWIPVSLNQLAEKAR